MKANPWLVVTGAGDRYGTLATPPNMVTMYIHVHVVTVNVELSSQLCNGSGFGRLVAPALARRISPLKAVF